jgi:hypothetical protein
MSTRSWAVDSGALGCCHRSSVTEASSCHNMGMLHPGLHKLQMLQPPGWPHRLEASDSEIPGSGSVCPCSACLQSQTELEAQLRDTIDMLRARTHAQSSRELEHVRRLQQHVRLEPIFDRLVST